ncbi:IS3 family transposase [Blastococcus sp. SYSU DS1021]
MLGLLKGAFCDWRARGGGPTAAEVEEAYAIEAVRKHWAEHRRVYGVRRLTAEVRHRGHRWNRNRVARLMRAGGMEGVHRRWRGKCRRLSGSTATAHGPGRANLHRVRTRSAVGR